MSSRFTNTEAQQQQRIVALHGGRLEVESDLARGTCFSFSLPAAAVVPTGRG